MTSPSICGNKEALVAYLYGECDAAERDALDAHILTCLTCATELREMRGVRVALGEWTVPDAELGFQIVQALEPAPRARWLWPVPVWAQAAAAVFVVVAGCAALANLEIRYGSDGLVVRTGWTRAPLGPGAIGVESAAPQALPAAWQSELNALRDQFREEFAAHEQRVAAASHDDASARVVAARVGNANDAEVLRRVQDMLDQREKRQQSELALRLTMLVRDLEAKRRIDMARIEQSFGRIQGQTGTAIANQRDWTTNYTNNLLRTSLRQPQ